MGENILVFLVLLLVRKVSKIYLVICLVVIDFNIELIFDERKEVICVLLLIMY